MDTVVEFPRWIAWSVYSLPLVAVVLSFVTRKPLWSRVVGVVGVTALTVVISLTMLRPMRFGWDATAIHDGTFGSLVTVPWTDVLEARVVPGFYRSPYAPVARTAGTAFDRVRSGHFRLADGTSARVFVQGGSGDALWLRTADGVYLYAPDAFAPFASAARERLRVPVTE